MTQRLLEGLDIVAGFVPVDMQTAANDGDWVNLTSWGRCLVVLFKAIGTAGDDPVFTLQQATDNTGTAAKALTFTTIYSKVGTQTGIGAWTKNAQAAAGTYTDAVSAEAQSLICVEIRAEDLDAANGFDHLRITIPDVGSNAQLGAAFYIMANPLAGGATLLPAIA